jgi:hypothetical protein
MKVARQPLLFSVITFTPLDKYDNMIVFVPSLLSSYSPYQKQPVVNQSDTQRRGDGPRDSGLRAGTGTGTHRIRLHHPVILELGLAVLTEQCTKARCVDAAVNDAQRDVHALRVELPSERLGQRALTTLARGESADACAVAVAPVPLRGGGCGGEEETEERSRGIVCWAKRYRPRLLRGQRKWEFRIGQPGDRVGMVAQVGETASQ